MLSPKLIVANFKSHQTASQAKSWINIFTSIYSPNPQKSKVILAPSFTNLSLYKDLPDASLATQDVSPFPPGSYTGAVNARQLKDLGVNYCLVGHSERRRWFTETDQTSAQKITELWDADITPILCLDLDYAASQIAAIELNSNPLIIAYEPLESIGNGNPQPPAEVSQSVSQIQNLAPGVPIIYGGSVNSQNANGYLSVPGISGLLIATACIDPNEFNAIINQS